MALKQSQHVIQGMSRDTTVSKFNPKYAFDALNIRITARDNNTLLSVTNEKGNKEVPSNHEIVGTYLGSCILNNTLIVFAKDSIADRIYKFIYEDGKFTSSVLFMGQLNLDVEHPVETLGIYENEDIQKVYWIDGINQARVLNITKDVYINADEFDFIGTIHTNATINVDKANSSGTFSQGVIQYAFSYYNKYGKETNIFSTSPLLYISHKDRGASPEDTVTCSFNIQLNNLDTSYDYVRIYSIHRTSIDATPQVKVVADLVTTTQLYVDTGTTGESVDPTILLYVGGEEIAPYTIEQKDNTLFLGNYTIKRELISTDLQNQIKKNANVTFFKRTLTDVSDLGDMYRANYQLNYNSNQIKGFQKGEVYRVGIQFQDTKGKWSEVVFVGDYECTERNESHNSLNQFILYASAINVTVNDVATVQAIKDLGYIKARGVVCFPDFNDRNVICQGILCPTVANYKDRLDNSPFAQSSWFTRPFMPDDSWVNEYGTMAHDCSKGEVPYFYHNGPIGSASVNDLTRSEIQIALGVVPYIPTGTDPGEYTDKSISEFLVDHNIVTMHSPEVEFNDNLQNLVNADYKLRIIGAVALNNTLSDISLTTSTPTLGLKSLGFFKGKVCNTRMWNYSITGEGGRQISSGLFWADALKWDRIQELALSQRLWLIYPWHRNGSLINAGIPTDGNTRPAALGRKVISNLKFSANNIYLDTPWTDDSGEYTGITPVNSWTTGMVRIKAPLNSGLQDLNYYADIDKVLPFNRSNTVSEVYNNGYLLYTTKNEVDNGSITPIFNDANNQVVSVNTFDSSIFPMNEEDLYGTEPVSMKYKSNPHLVFAFNYTASGKQSVLPKNNTCTSILQNSPTTKPFWNTNAPDGDTVYQGNITYTDNQDRAILWLAELYRDNVVNRFGGDTPEVILNNTFLPAGDAVLIGDNIDINCTEGDTYIQRYDCLRTFASTSEDQNSIVDIVSFMCETRINIDGRYDRNRGLVNNLNMNPTNFNLFNPVYSQSNNYFTFRTIDYERYSNSLFPNSLTWTKEKTLGEDIDTWTNITLASNLTLDGNRGNLNLLKKIGNDIFAFQDKGISRVLFNSTVQVNTNDGIPIEIANSGKVDGKRYVTLTNGLQNKWASYLSPSGLYFIDNFTNDLMLFNGESLKSLSSEKGYRTFINKYNSTDIWNARDFSNFIIQRDSTNDEIYYIHKDFALCYSELLQEFVSFFSYDSVPLMFNMDGKFFSLKNGIIWEHEAGDYNSFYGVTKPYYITVIDNSDEPYDKIYNTLEFRADTWDGDTLLNNVTFDTLDVWNEYQHGTLNLTTALGQPSPLKKKFRVWRANIPRDNSNKLNRIRNTWVYVKLAMNDPKTYRTEFHDMILHYFV